ncbi:hypothetical protein [Lishizhenia sp.]|uniref:hypothetical protein n=1 Tax=Lishizhenia sp. TaxID=2497594 RepID=UPI00299E49E4|nr:hypothetical protein [Lishizhenia sp.]MDX1444798.1 hypothetical protein [Lishizhenia sp.]
MKRKHQFTLLLSLFFLFSCGDKEPTFADITVKDSDNQVVPGVRVIIYGSSTETPNKDGDVVLRDTLTTDTFGVASFDFTENFKLGQAGFAVLDIAAEVTDANSNVLKGTGIIKIVEEEVNKEVVYIQ